MPAATASPFLLQRVTALAGPFGSGKTELAIGLATLAARQAREESRWTGGTVLGDLDVIKPYFRSREARESLGQAGVRLIAPSAALASADLPIVVPELRGFVARADTQVILDVGGDSVGARALGSLSDVAREADCDLLLVLNRYRPFMGSLEEVLAQARGIAAAARLDITGVVSNTNLVEETTRQDIEWGLELARAVALALGAPLRLLALPEHLASAFEALPDLPPAVVVRRRMLPVFLGGVVLAAPAPPSTRPSRGAAL